MKICLFEYGIYLGASDSGFINQNSFDGVDLAYCDYTIYLDRYVDASYGQMNKNIFSNILK